MTDRPDIILGLDVGTTAAKASLFSLDGSVRLTESREYPLLGPRPGWHVQEPAAIADGVLQAMRDAVAQVDPGRVLGISVSSFEDLDKDVIAAAISKIRSL